MAPATTHVKAATHLPSSSTSPAGARIISQQTKKTWALATKIVPATQQRNAATKEAASTDTFHYLTHHLAPQEHPAQAAQHHRNRLVFLTLTQLNMFQASLGRFLESLSSDVRPWHVSVLP